MRSKQRSMFMLHYIASAARVGTVSLCMFWAGKVSAHPQNSGVVPLDPFEITFSASGYHLKTEFDYYIAIPAEEECLVFRATYDPTYEGENHPNNFRRFIIREAIQPDENNQMRPSELEGRWLLTLIREPAELKPFIREGRVEEAHLREIQGCQFVWEEIRSPK